MNDETLDDLAESVARRAHLLGRTVAVAESLTGGMASAALARAEGAAEWFRGSVVAYSSEVKYDLLDVPDGPVVSGPAAAAMARRVRELLGADLAVAVTGSGGPDPQDGKPPGTVYLAAAGEPGGEEVFRLDLEGEPGEICGSAAAEVLRVLVARLTAQQPPVGATGGSG
ncbi:CinA family protein [Pseudonocardia parietis]|uniref:Nicotinamide-nucleotide amidase n=1 Tax=Pseudonocardia parietis TaxID=570936 RepID=A0ABS4VV21_9PSEU|nr:CinA family protein [Pseudonocardia parietis]MBP2367769.1 nicotinamide-nucleotide amidase [Pseudonocardia parietis]